MKPMRISYSIAASWDRGDIDAAVAPFIGVEMPENEFMARGKRWHRRFELETKRTGNAPKIFGGEVLNKASVEASTKRVVQLNEWLTLSGVLDRIDAPEWLKNGQRVTDYKVSKRPATEWANSMQPQTYKILYPEATIAELQCLNPYLADNDPDRVSMAIIHLTDKSMQQGAEWLLTQAMELQLYLASNHFDHNLMREVPDIAEPEPTND